MSRIGERDRGHRAWVSSIARRDDYWLERAEVARRTSSLFSTAPGVWRPTFAAPTGRRLVSTAEATLPGQLSAKRSIRRSLFFSSATPGDQDLHPDDKNTRRRIEALALKEEITDFLRLQGPTALPPGPKALHHWQYTNCTDERLDPHEAKHVRNLGGFKNGLTPQEKLFLCDNGLDDPVHLIRKIMPLLDSNAWCACRYPWTCDTRIEPPPISSDPLLNHLRKRKDSAVASLQHHQWADPGRWLTILFGCNPTRQGARTCVKALWYTPGLHSFRSSLCADWGCSCEAYVSYIPGLRDSRLA